MAQFGNPQQRHLQHPSQGLGSASLVTPSVGAQLGFGNAEPNLSLFGSNGANTHNQYGNGFVGIGGDGAGLGGHAAQAGFAHGAALQRQELHESNGTNQADWKGMSKGRIRDVWRNNLAQEMTVIRSLIDKYPFVSMDTEFPGIVARPMGTFTTKADYHYQCLRCNVDLLKIIQLGITLFTLDGELPPPHPAESSGVNGSSYPNNLMPYPCTWQFNFRFSLETDMYAQASIDLLQKSGLDFQLHEKNGIDPLEFGSCLITSGLVLTEDVRWISFHSGYDFGYLMKIMLCKPLPDDEREFRKLMNIFFPSIYDIKYLMKHASGTQTVNNTPLAPQAHQVIANLGQQSGLQAIADELNVKRVGNQHQAGSDSLVTGKIFWEVRRVVFGGHIDDEKYLGQIWGLDWVGAPAPAAVAAAAAAVAAAAAAQHQNHSTNNGATAMYSNNGNATTTPNTDHVSLANTPGPHGQNRGTGVGALTPSGVGGVGGGVFSGFQFGRG
ncbi:MAG: hypothetical protein M1815_001945 [Lichina confinis]|nr:MAG: hypothetical protein M1815_001945 [Lichina confinis]